ncbi:MAG: alkaline phosphatase family protein, partial [Deltaproteobacteria bacterium]|nr:alkaline phosphatase family protein [Deltaproteobacteria bacterium]
RKFPPIDLGVPTLDQVFRDKGLRYCVRMLKGSPDQTEIEFLRSNSKEFDVFFYFDHILDSMGHRAGGETGKLRAEIEMLDRFLKEAWKILGAEGGCEIVLFSDHGMTKVERTFDLFRALKDFTLGKDYLVFLDSSFGRFWFPDPQKRELIFNQLKDAPGRFLTREEREEYGLLFKDDRYGQEIMIADEGVVFHPNYISPSFFRTRNYPDRGTHGFWPEFPSSYGIFAYRGACWKPDDSREILAVDVYKIVCHILDEAFGK